MIYNLHAIYSKPIPFVTNHFIKPNLSDMINQYFESNALNKNEYRLFELVFLFFALQLTERCLSLKKEMKLVIV